MSLVGSLRRSVLCSLTFSRFSHSIAPNAAARSPMCALYSHTLGRNFSSTGTDKVNMTLEEGEASVADAEVQSQKHQKLSRKKKRQRKEHLGSERMQTGFNVASLRKDKSWTETFGSLSPEDISQRDFTDEREDQVKDHHLRLSTTGRKHSPYYYGRLVEKLCQQGKLDEAVDVVQNMMLKEDRVMPVSYNFTVLIGALGRAGDIKTAFRLFNQMKKMGLQPESPTYTALFNACANASDKKLALEKAENLRALIKAKDFTPNQTTYHSMIKCFAMMGQVQTAFRIADEMHEGQILMNHETFSFLLMACLGDQKTGFKLALEVWRRMRKRRVTFDKYHYNLLLKAVQTCGVASEPLPTSKAHLSGTKAPLSLPSPEGPSTSTALAHLSTPTMNILNPRTDLESVLDAHPVETAEERLALIGGMQSLLSHMSKDGASPDIKTFTQLMHCLPSTIEAENELLAAMDWHKVPLDTSFCNLLIRRRNLRKNPEQAKDVLVLMSEKNLQPNMMTYGCLAMGCSKEKDGRQLIADMKAEDISPSPQIWGLLVHNSSLNFGYKKRLLQEMTSQGCLPNEILIRHIERQIQRAKKQIVLMEHGKDVPAFIRSDAFQRDFADFLIYYKKWLRQTELHSSVE